MADTMFNAVRFKSNNDKDFGTEVKKRVNDYFKKKGVPRTADYRMWIKVVAMPLIYFIPFGFIMSDMFADNLPIFYALWIVMGFGIGGIGLGVMHDANHGAISKNMKVNNFIGYVLNLAGGNALNWKIQHNVLHHSFTNVDGYDEDIDPGGVMRFSPHQPHKPMFKYQTYYAWILYGLMTFTWVTFKDFVQLTRYSKRGLLKGQGITLQKALTILLFQKILYHIYILVIPIMVLDVAWYHIILAWFGMHFTAGLILGLVFQPAHVIPETQYPLPDKNNVVDGDWAKYQMLTTANFAPTNKILSWYVGGLNYQIEHHLFPNMSHVHHPEISKIVKKTAKEFNLPYYSEPTFFGAIANHWRMLSKLSKV